MLGQVTYARPCTIDMLIIVAHPHSCSLVYVKSFWGIVVMHDLLSQVECSVCRVPWSSFLHSFFMLCKVCLVEIAAEICIFLISKELK